MIKVDSITERSQRCERAGQILDVAAGPARSIDGHGDGGRAPIKDRRENQPR